MRFAALLVLLGGCEGRGAIGNPVTALTPDTHTKFPIAAGSSHAIDCNSCHGEFDTFTQFSCLSGGCHTAAETTPNHNGVSGYLYESSACYSCHPDGKGVDHSLFFPIGPGTRHNLACSTCHTDPNNHQIFTCMSGGCHPQNETDGHHTEVGGYVYDSNNCYGCHYRGKK
jgi:hypothetical protein